MKYWLQRVLYGRNGPDQLSLAILIFGLVLTVTSWFVPVAAVRSVLNIADYLCLVLFFYRVLSRNLYKRREENIRFLNAISPVRSWFRLRGRMLREARQYKYLRCPGCRQRLRAPRGKGNIRITCRSCTRQFEVRV